MLISNSVTAPAQNQLKSLASRNGTAFMKLDFKPEGVLEQINVGYVQWHMCCSSWTPPKHSVGSRTLPKGTNLLQLSLA